MSSILKPVLGSQLNCGHPLAPRGGLWLFNEGSGGQVLDLSENGNTGVFGGDTAWEAGKFGPRTVYDGDGDYINCGLNSSLNMGSGDFTLLCWVKTSSATVQHLLNKGFSKRYSMRIYSSVAHIEIDDDVGVDVVKNGAITVTDGIVHQIIATKDGNLLRLYIDGVEDGSGANVTGAASLDDVTYPFAIGVHSANFALQPLLGSMELAMVWNRALSAFEVALLHREPFCMFGRDPIELWAAATQGGAPPAGIPIFRRRRAG